METLPPLLRREFTFYVAFYTLDSYESLPWPDLLPTAGKLFLPSALARAKVSLCNSFQELWKAEGISL